MTKRYYPMKTSPEFKKFLQDIKVERIKNGKDEIMKSDRRLTLALTRSSLLPKLKEALVESEMKDEKDD